MEFADTITTRAALREVLDEPSELVTSKEVSELDDFCRDFIARSPFILIASSDGAGSIDVSATSGQTRSRTSFSTHLWE